MAVSTITRTSWTDDNGSGTTGTIIKNSELQAIYDAIDQLLSGTGSYATLSFGGVIRIEGAGLQFKAAAAPAVSIAGEAKIILDSSDNTLKKSENGGAFAALGTPVWQDPTVISRWREIVRS